MSDDFDKRSAYEGKRTEVKEVDVDREEGWKDIQQDAGQVWSDKGPNLTGKCPACNVELS